MGAGASAATALQGSSQEELQAVISQLPAGERERIRAAVSASTAAGEAPAGGTAASSPAEGAAAPAAAEVSAAGEEAAAPAAEAKEPASSSGKEPVATSAPFLDEYFAKAQARTEKLIADQEKLMAIAMAPEAQQKLKDDSKEWFQTEAKPLLEKSFKHHDTRENDLLDKEEAAAFFQHLISAETKLAKAMSALSIEAGIKMSMAMLENMLSAEERKEVQPQIEEQMKVAVEAAKKAVQEKEDAYIANKDKHDAMAFKVLDVNNDGTLQLSEFLAAFEPETERNAQLHLALGFLTQEEIDQQKKMEAAAAKEASDSEGCPQQ